MFFFGGGFKLRQKPKFKIILSLVGEMLLICYYGRVDFFVSVLLLYFVYSRREMLEGKASFWTSKIFQIKEKKNIKITREKTKVYF